MNVNAEEEGFHISFSISGLTENEMIALSHILTHYRMTGSVDEYQDIAEKLDLKIEEILE